MYFVSTIYWNLIACHIIKFLSLLVRKRMATWSIQQSSTEQIYVHHMRNVICLLPRIHYILRIFCSWHFRMSAGATHINASCFILVSLLSSLNRAYFLLAVAATSVPTTEKCGRAFPYFPLTVALMDFQAFTVAELMCAWRLCADGWGKYICILCVIPLFRILIEFSYIWIMRGDAYNCHKPPPQTFTHAVTDTPLLCLSTIALE